MDKRILQCCFLMGPLLTLIFAIGFIVLAGFLPPPAPTLSAADVAIFYQQHPTATQIGMFVMMTGLAMLAPWGAALAALLRPLEKGTPILCYTQLVNCAIATMVVIFCPLFWGAAAYRPFDTSPDVIRVMNDIGWFLVLAPWPPFTFWFLAVAFAIFKDKRPQPHFPRWTGYLSIWAAVVFIPAGLVLVFKTGPFAWNGIIAFYIPMAAFFVWLIVLSVYALKATKNHPA